MSNKTALLIGVAKYDDILLEDYQLPNCIQDVDDLQKLLEDERGKFTCIPQKDPKRQEIEQRIEKVLLSSRAKNTDYALIYFSGHGHPDGYLAAKDYTPDNKGVSMKWLIDVLNQSVIPEITLILDCCYAGAIQQSLRENISILAATQHNDVAGAGMGRNSLFTKILKQGLEGAAADIKGNITISSLYQHADASLSILQQQPVFKSFIDKVTPIRTCTPVIPFSEVQKIAQEDFFKTKDFAFRLHNDMIPRNAKEEGLNDFITLNKYEKAGLIECDEQLTLLQAALRGRKCTLSIKGQFVWDQVKNKNFK